MSINRMIPGPAIQVCQNDQIVVNLVNDLRMSESTSIHWHGQTQKETPYMDGVGMITQCPILAHTHFQYKFEIFF
jgi:FtsP/CotA-like multicopper oxidase with cupredoxin domain